MCVLYMGLWCWVRIGGQWGLELQGAHGVVLGLAAGAQRLHAEVQ